MSSDSLLLDAMLAISSGTTIRQAFSSLALVAQKWQQHWFIYILLLWLLWEAKRMILIFHLGKPVSIWRRIKIDKLTESSQSKMSISLANLHSSEGLSPVFKVFLALGVWLRKALPKWVFLRGSKAQQLRTESRHEENLSRYRIEIDILSSSPQRTKSKRWTAHRSITSPLEGSCTMWALAPSSTTPTAYS